MSENTGSERENGAVAEDAVGRRPRIAIAGDVVNRATAELDDRQRSAIRWYHAYAIEQGWGLREAAEKIRRDHNTLYQIWTGRHKAGKEEIVREIVSLRRLVEERRGIRKLEFVETDLSKKIWQVCEAALAYQRIALIFGDSQIGKTASLLAYARSHNHGETTYVSMPTGGTLGFFLGVMAKALRIGNAGRGEVELRGRILSAFDDRMLLIVDECHQAFSLCGHRSDPARHARALEFIRELHDKTGCGVVLAATNVLRDEMEQGRAAGILAQIRRRRLIRLQLPSMPSNKTLAMFAAAYGLDAASGEDLAMQTDVVREEALGFWLTLLRMASNRATKANRALEWADVRKAHAMLRAMESCD